MRTQRTSRHSMRQIIIMWLCLCVSAYGSWRLGLDVRVSVSLYNCVCVIVEMFLLCTQQSNSLDNPATPWNSKYEDDLSYMSFLLSLNNFPYMNRTSRVLAVSRFLNGWRDPVNNFIRCFSVNWELCNRFGDNMDATRMVKSSSIRPGVV
jgi:hypothetical protein